MTLTFSTCFRSRFLPFVLAGYAGLSALGAEPSRYFEINVVDKATGRGVPLVELVTVDGVRHITDNAGRIAYEEHGQAGQTVFFTVFPQGYRVPKDGFGIEGARFKIEPGKSEEIALERINLAERLYRNTGQGLYRDSLMLGKETPLREPMGAGQVAGQDSVQVARYRDKLYWFWGDTARLSYPLGLFRTSGAVTPLPGQPGADPARGLDFTYFAAADGFSRAMAEVANPKGVIWIDGVCTAPDETGRERMLCRYMRREGLGELYEQGFMIYNDTREIFEMKAMLPNNEQWRCIREHPVRIKDGETEFLMFDRPFPLTRVRPTVADITDPAKYESWSCMDPKADPAFAKPRRTADGALDWKWQAGPPTTQKEEARWLKEKLIKADETRFFPEDAGNPGRRVMLHAGTVYWNARRKRWILVGNEIAQDKKSPSFLGEVWYSEADSPQGPWRKAVRIATHDKQSFYNPIQHPYFDADGGRTIYFEGTYTNTFTDAPATQRYNYNQVMYRLDLDHPALRAAFPR
jgi:hypothetical protein